MKNVTNEERFQIVVDIASEFRCIGKTFEAKILNKPLPEPSDNEPQFAAGVNVRDVVDYVISRLG